MAIITQVDRPGSIAEFTNLVDALGGFVPEESYNYLATCGERGIASWYWDT